MIPIVGMKLRFPNGEVEFLRHYPGQWKVLAVIEVLRDDKPVKRTVTKRIADSTAQEWVDEANRHISCSGGCYMFEDGSKERVACQKKCRLQQSVESE